MSVRYAVWPGTAQEAQELKLAVLNNCTCDPNNPVVTCPAHKILLDLRVMALLLFGRYMAPRWLAEEFSLVALPE